MTQNYSEGIRITYCNDDDDNGSDSRIVIDDTNSAMITEGSISDRFSVTGRY